MNYFNNIEQLIKMNSQNGEITEMLKEMSTASTEFIKDFKDDYTKMTDWGHKYFCEDDGELLTYSRHTPGIHKCPICSKVYKSDELDRVWLYFYRNEAIDSALKSATVYSVTGDKEQLAIATKIVEFYSKNYTNFEIHARDTSIEVTNTGKLGYARIMPQELNEAIISTKLASIYEMIKTSISAELDGYIKNMFVEIYNILKPQVHKVHNKPCWSISAIGVMGLAIDNKEMIDFTFNAEFNINRQLKEGVTESNMWYEGSMHYNFFTIEGVIALLHFCKLKNVECSYIEERVYDMLVAAYNYAFDNKVFPNPNDGWPDLSLKTFSFVYHLANKIYGDDKMLEMLKAIEEASIDRIDPKLARPYYFNNKISFEELVFNTDFRERSQN